MRSIIFFSLLVSLNGCATYYISQHRVDFDKEGNVTAEQGVRGFAFVANQSDEVLFNASESSEGKDITFGKSGTDGSAELDAISDIACTINPLSCLGPD
jgi:hypothetical protein